MASTRKVQVGEIELPVLEAGQGGRPLLLAHGFTGGGVDFAGHLDELGEVGWHVVAPTHRGHLGSVALPDEADYSFELIATDLVGLADALGWDRFALLGHSMGGMVAQVVAIRHPQRVSSLVLMDTCHGALSVDPDLAATAIHLVREKGMDALADAMAAQPGGGPLETAAAKRLREERPDLVELDDRKLRGCAPAMYAAMITEMLGATDRLAELRPLPMPTLVLVGEQDAPFVEPSRRMADAIPGARLQLIPDAGHSPQQETPEAWAEAVLTFLHVARERRNGKTAETNGNGRTAPAPAASGQPATAGEPA